MTNNMSDCAKTSELTKNIANSIVKNFANNNEGRKLTTLP